MKVDRKSLLQLAGLMVILLGGWVGYLVWCAQRNLVTLDVRDADVREVIQSIERQTRETLVMDENVQGKVTFAVKRAPLEAVLAIIEDQVSVRWSVLYPLYSATSRLEALKKALAGAGDAAATGWTNLQGRGSPWGFGGRGGPPGPGGFGDPLQAQNDFISLEILNKDLAFTTLALGRYAQTRVIPEDGTEAIISVKFQRTPVDTAVARIAKQARRSWTKLYALRGDRDRERGPGPMASREDGERRRPDEGERDRRREWTDMTPEQREQRRQQRDALEEELKQTLPAAERQKLDQAQAERDKFFQEMQNLTPEQRRERFSQMAGGSGGPGGGGGREQRMLSRIKNTTPEQRVDRYRAYEQRRQRWQQQGGGPGRGGR
ncbi:MAG: hypothetical protein RJA22_537 [Verrucomicrobiota bacterium]|jgi:hypothetical protein